MKSIFNNDRKSQIRYKWLKITSILQRKNLNSVVFGKRIVIQRYKKLIIAGNFCNNANFLYNVTDGSYPEINCSDVVIMLSVTINYLKILFYDKILIMLLKLS
jgi:hypothetical protein